jgi:hypothetical protein
MAFGNIYRYPTLACLGIIFAHYASIRKYTKLINSNCESGGEIEISIICTYQWQYTESRPLHLYIWETNMDMQFDCLRENVRTLLC